MSMNQWLLKLLSGPHAGAEMQLEERTYRVGRSEDCDIVIHDETLPEEAFSLLVDDSGIQLQRCDLAAKLHCGGQPIEAESLDVEAYAIYSLGLLHFCFGTSNTDWPVLHVPATNPSLEPATHTSPANRISTGAANLQRLSARSSLAINFSIFAFLVLTGLMLSNGELDAGTVQLKPSIDVAESVQRNLGLPGLLVTRQETPSHDERWLIDGYVQTAAEMGALKEHLQSMGVAYQLNVRTMENVLHSTETLLKQLQLRNLVVSIGEQPGELVISGVQADVARWEQVKKLLLTDISGLTSITDQVESTESRISLLKKWIRLEGLDEDVVVNATDGRLTITSDIQLEKSEAWKRIKAKFEERFGGSIDLAVLTNNRPSMAIRSVSLGPVPYLVLANGRRYSQGSHVSHGYYLDQIHQDDVVLRRGDELLKYPVGPSVQ